MVIKEMNQKLRLEILSVIMPVGIECRSVCVTQRPCI